MEEAKKTPRWVVDAPHCGSSRRPTV